MAKKKQTKTATAKRSTSKTDPPVLALQHLDGCPGDRSEAYREVTPQGERVIVSRCLDCPAHRVDAE